MAIHRAETDNHHYGAALFAVDTMETCMRLIDLLGSEKGWAAGELCAKLDGVRLAAHSVLRFQFFHEPAKTKPKTKATTIFKPVKKGRAPRKVRGK